MSEIGIITYNAPHLKTEQVFQKLLLNYPGIESRLKFYTLPFSQRKIRNTLITHRPDQSAGTTPQALAQRYGISIDQLQSDTEINNECDIYLVLGAGILSPECVKNKRLLNAHPGIIPLCRGLDAFKWCIHQNRPLGNTLHFIDEEVDAGEVVTVIDTPVYATDTIHTLSRRHYEMELDILGNYQWHLQHAQNKYIDAEEHASTRRMPVELEQEVLNSFENWKQTHVAKK